MRGWVRASSVNALLVATLSVAAFLTATAPAGAYDGWHLESATTIEGKGSAFDYINFDAARNRLFLGRRKEGLHVFDVATRKVIKVIDGTPKHSSNGALLIPEFDLAISNNEDGTITPFTLSTLEAREAIRVTEELDASYYDEATKRIFVHSEGDKRGTDLVILEAPSLKPLHKIRLVTKKAEHGAGDGRGNYFIAARDIESVYRIDARAMKVTAKWPTPGCGQTTSLTYNRADQRVLLGCRGNDDTPPSFAVLDPESGEITFTAEIGAGNDGIIYDPELKRAFLANGVGANLMIFERLEPDKYRLTDALGTRPMVKTIAYDPNNKKLFAFTAETSADASKPIKKALAPFYPNTYFPDTFTVLTYSRLHKP